MNAPVLANLIIIFLLLGIVFYLIIIYNRFQALKNAKEATFNQIKVSLKKRLDVLTENLENLKSSAKFEKDILYRLTRLRSRALEIKNTRELSQLEKEIVSLLPSVKFTMEAYPELKTIELAKKLADTIKDLEDEIARQRYFFNNIVQEYNTLIDTFPSNIVAKIFNFKKEDYLTIEIKEEERPSLKW